LSVGQESQGGRSEGRVLFYSEIATVHNQVINIYLFIIKLVGKIVDIGVAAIIGTVLCLLEKTGRDGLEVFSTFQLPFWELRIENQIEVLESALCFTLPQDPTKSEFPK